MCTFDLKNIYFFSLARSSYSNFSLFKRVLLGGQFSLRFQYSKMIFLLKLFSKIAFKFITSHWGTILMKKQTLKISFFVKVSVLFSVRFTHYNTHCNWKTQKTACGCHSRYVQRICQELRSPVIKKTERTTQVSDSSIPFYAYCFPYNAIIIIL